MLAFARLLISVSILSSPVLSFVSSGTSKHRQYRFHISTSVSVPDGEEGANGRSYLDNVKDALQQDELTEIATEQAISAKQQKLRDRNTDVVARGRYELTLRRPLGFSIGEQEDDGYVVVTAIHDTAPRVVRYAVQVGDRLVAVAPALGDTLWPVSTVEGATAAVTGRMPGSTVRIQFERTAASSPSAVVQEATRSIVDDAVEKAVVSTSSTTTTNLQPWELLSRCRDILARYRIDQGSTTTTPASLQMSSMVVDKVVDALVGIPVDAVTLSMMMTLYTACHKPDAAIAVFEAATGFAGDGSTRPVSSVEGGMVPCEAALDLHTGTALMRAQASRGGQTAVWRILAALEGRSDDAKIDDVAPWPWTGSYGSIKVDTVCYNVALAAAEKQSGSSARALLQALELFERMAEPGAVTSGPVKDVITYNTLMSALVRSGRNDAAWALFHDMKRYDEKLIKPNKITYTTLMRACADSSTHNEDVQELFYDMMERGIRPDTVTYNTMIRSLVDHKRLTQAMELVNDMERKSIAPDSKTYSLLMNGLLKADKPYAVLKLFNSASANPQTTGLMDNIYIGTTAIVAASHLGDHATALNIVARMTAKGVQPNVKTLTAVMGACMSSNRPDLAVQVFEKMQHADGYATRQGIRALCQAERVEEAAHIILSQPPRGGKGGVIKGNLMMHSYKDTLESALHYNKMALARELLEDLLERRFIPSKIMLRSITDVFGLKRQYNGGPSTVITMEQFRFLLFFIDKLEERNIPIESILYVTTLVAARRLDKKAQRMGRLIVKSNNLEALRETASAKDPEAMNWENLFDQRGGRAPENGVLPRIRMRLASADVPRVLRAEKALNAGGS